MPFVKAKVVSRSEEETILTELGHNSLTFTGYRVDNFRGTCVLPVVGL